MIQWNKNKNLRETQNLNFDEFVKFEELLDEAVSGAFAEEINFLGNDTSMKEHLWVKFEP